MALELILPTRYRQPISACTICGTEFFTGEEAKAVAHGAKCAADHINELRAAYAKKRPAGLFTDADPEYAGWVREHGRVG